MDKFLKIAVLLTAVDKMSSVIGSAMGKSKEEIAKFKQATEQMRDGMLAMEASKKGLQFLDKTVDSYKEINAAGQQLRASLLQPGGILDERVYEKIYKYSEKLSDKYAFSTAEYLDMIRVMKNNNVAVTDITSGMGEAAAQLSEIYGMSPAPIGEFAAHMRNDMGVAVKDMYQVMDLASRTYGVGVGKTGEENVYHMNQFFSKVGLGLKSLRVEGIEASKSMGALGAIFMRKGISGETVGTNFRRILDGLRDPAKLHKANELAAQYGKSLSFFDAQGKFKGVENFVQQLNSLSGLKVTEIAAILKPFSGRQGLSTDFLEVMAHGGVGEFNNMMRDLYAKQATMTQKSDEILKGVAKQEQVQKSSWTNTKAAFGATLAPVYNSYYRLSNKVAHGLRNIIEKNPKLSQTAAVLLAIGSAGLGMWGVVSVLKAVAAGEALLGISGPAGLALRAFKLLQFAAFAMRYHFMFSVVPALVSAATATWTFTVALLANPITWIVLAVIALGAAVIYMVKHWKTVGPFFSNLWKKIKEYFFAAVKWIWKYVIPFFMPWVLIIQHWDKIGPYFHELWEKVKKIFYNVVMWFGKLGMSFFNAGKNIIKNIWEGMKSLIHKPVEAIKNMAHKIRQYLPFSPAKEGPLKDIHRIRLIETIAEAVNPKSMLQKMQGVATAIFNFKPVGSGNMSTTTMAMAGGGSLNGANLNFNFNYYANDKRNWSDEKKQFMKDVKDNAKQIADVVQKEIERASRKKY